MINKNKKPIIETVCADNGEHSHFRLINVENGETLWEEPETSDNSDYTLALERIIYEECCDDYKESTKKVKQIVEEIQRLNATHFA